MNSENLQEILNATTISLDSPVVMMVAFIGMSLLPMILLGVTSFVKLSVVFGILRNALGLAQIPSAGVTTLLSIALTIHIMAPVAELAISEVSKDIPKNVKEENKVNTTSSEAKNTLSVGGVLNLASKGSEPLRCFLTRNANREERLYFANTQIHKENLKESLLKEPQEITSVKGEELLCPKLENETWQSLIPAFVISELKEAFSIGFRIFIPFLVIDLIVANILMGLGMMMVSPTSISLPLKILLFVLSDGWFLLCQSLCDGYAN